MNFSNYFGVVVWYICLSLGIILLLLLAGMIVMLAESAIASYKDWVHPKFLIMYNQIYCWCEKACESICESAKKLRKVKTQFQINITPSSVCSKIFIIGEPSGCEPIDVWLEEYHAPKIRGFTLTEIGFGSRPDENHLSVPRFQDGKDDVKMTIKGPSDFKHTLIVYILQHRSNYCKTTK